MIRVPSSEVRELPVFALKADEKEAFVTQSADQAELPELRCPAELVRTPSPVM